MKSLRQNQSGILYVLVTIVLFLFVIGFVAFTAWAIMTPISDALTPLADSYHDEAWTLSVQYGYAKTFMTNFWVYFMVLAFFGLTFWVIIYSQHRGQAV